MIQHDVIELRWCWRFYVRLTITLDNGKTARRRARPDRFDLAAAYARALARRAA